MDLYGQGVSIGQANSQTSATQQANMLARQFNDSLAGQLDEARVENDADANSKQQINMVSGATAGGKLLASSKAREDLLGKGLKGRKLGAEGFREVKVSAEEMGARGGNIKTGTYFTRGADGVAELRDAETGARRGSGLLVEGGSQASNLKVPIEQTYLADAPTETPTGAELGDSVEAGAGREAEAVGNEGAKISTSADALKTAEKGGAEIGVKLGATTLAKVGLAGVGGALDIARDVGRGKGLFDADTYGSNPQQRIGNIGNIIGSGLEVAGLLTAWTPFGVGLEGLGALVSVGSTALETYGDIKEEGDTEDQTETDIKSQSRGEAVSQQVTTAIGRSN
tara:strand:- start:1686 stop:2705 length:1020 start_codon:yes stop_codon:yes gene_type:complete